MMVAFFEWLDARPLLYWIVAWSCFALCVIASWIARPSTKDGPGGKWAAHPLLFVSLLFLTLFAFRWPSWFAPWELNPDESQIIAGAITLRDDPVFWKYVDGTTHGPLNEYLLTVGSLLGVPLTFIGARVTAALLIGGTLVGTWRTLSYLLPEHLARLGILPALAFWSFSWFGDFLHFSTELVPLLLLSMSVWSATAALNSTGERTGLLGLAGALLALVPLAKLQATPMALGLGVGGVVVLAWRYPPGWRRRIAAFVSGALLVGAALTAYLMIFGLEAQFWYSYVVSNLDYAEARNHPLAEMPNHFFAFATTGQSFAWFFYGCMAFALIQLQRTWQFAASRRRTVLVGAWIAVAVAYFCVLAPGRQVAHYLQLIVIPLAFLTALYLDTGESHVGNRGTRWMVLALFGGLTLIPQGLNRGLAIQEQLGRMQEFAAHRFSGPGRFIRERQRAGDLLSVWGWHAQLHVETQMAQGTRDAHSAFQIMRGSLRDFYRARYIRDMVHRQPEWFVDAVGPRRFAFEHRDVDGHETFPELARLIRDHYVLLADLDSMRIYQRIP